MARILFATAREAVRTASATARRRIPRPRLPRILRRRIRLPRLLDDEDVAALVTWTIRAVAIIGAAATLGTAVRVFRVTSGVF